MIKEDVISISIRAAKNMTFPISENNVPLTFTHLEHHPPVEVVIFLVAFFTSARMAGRIMLIQVREFERWIVWKGER